MRILRAAALAIVAASQPADADASGVARTYRYAVDWGPAPLAELRIRREEGDGRTRLEGEGRSVGLISIFADFLVRLDALYDDDRALLTTDSRWGDRMVERTVLYAPGATPEIVAETRVADEPEPARTPIPEDELAGTVDPLRPVLDTLDSLDAGRDCGGVWRVFSGTSRFDVTIAPAGRERLEADRDWTYSGEATRCAMRFRRVGGFPVERSSWSQDEADVTRHIWFARLDDGRHAPVRLRVSWPLGYATGRIDLRDARP